MISFENVYKRFGDKDVVSDLTLNIPEGKTVGLAGVSGAGKTTVIKLACGLLAPDSGNVRLAFKDPLKYRKKLKLGVFFSDRPLFQKNDTVAGNFNILKIIYRIPDEIFNRDYNELSERLGFGGYSGALVSDLSLGQRMRAELGAVFIFRPKLILLDEPFAGLDANAKKTVSDIINERRAEGAAFMISTRELSLTEGLCERIALIDKGKLIYYGSAERLRNEKSPYDSVMIKINGRLPDLGDLPIKSYKTDGGAITVFYDSKRISPAEITKFIIGQTEIKEIITRRPNPEDILTGA